MPEFSAAVSIRRSTRCDGCGRMMTPRTPAKIFYGYSDRNLVSHLECADKLPIWPPTVTHVLNPRQHHILRVLRRSAHLGGIWRQGSRRPSRPKPPSVE